MTSNPKATLADLQELVRTSSKENEKLRGQMETLQRQLKTKQEDIDYYLRALAQAKKSSIRRPLRIAN